MSRKINNFILNPQSTQKNKKSLYFGRSYTIGYSCYAGTVFGVQFIDGMCAIDANVFSLRSVHLWRWNIFLSFFFYVIFVKKLVLFSHLKLFCLLFSHQMSYVNVWRWMSNGFLTIVECDIAECQARLWARPLYTIMMFEWRISAATFNQSVHFLREDWLFIKLHVQCNICADSFHFLWYC